MTKSKLEQQELLLTELSHEVNNLQIKVQVIAEKQEAQLQRHHSVKETFAKLEKRLHSLENFMLASLQRLSFLKGIAKFWPLLVILTGALISTGAFMDHQREAEKLSEKMELLHEPV